MLGVVQDFIALTMWTFTTDDLSTTTTFVTRNLGLREHAREYLLANDLDTGTVAARARVYIIRGSCTRTSAVVAEDPLLHHELWEREYMPSIYGRD